MLNKAIIQGRLTTDPELRVTTNGVNVTTFTLAVERNYAKTGEQRETDFINVVAWSGTADFVCNYFSKGQMMIAEGAIQTRNYEDRQGNKRTAVEVVAEKVYFSGKKETEARPDNNEFPF